MLNLFKSNSIDDSDLRKAWVEISGSDLKKLTDIDELIRAIKIPDNNDKKFVHYKVKVIKDYLEGLLPDNKNLYNDYILAAINFKHKIEPLLDKHKTKKSKYYFAVLSTWQHSVMIIKANEFIKKSSLKKDN